MEFSLKNLKLKRKHVFHLIQFPGSDLSWKQFSLLLFLCCQENLINRNLYLDFHWKTKQMEVICKKKTFLELFLVFCCLCEVWVWLEEEKCKTQFEQDPGSRILHWISSNLLWLPDYWYSFKTKSQENFDWNICCATTKHETFLGLLKRGGLIDKAEKHP